MAGNRASSSLSSETSPMVNREVVLFLFQLEMDAQLQRALTYEKFDVAQEVRDRRQQVDQALQELQQSKGYGCGARRAFNSAQLDFAPQALSIRAKLNLAIEEERYTDAAVLRDELAGVEERAAEAELPCPVGEPQFTLGQMVVHNTKGYRGIVCGWDLACCETAEWQLKAGIPSLQDGPDQVFYHVLVDASDWPEQFDEPPVMYVAEELLDEASMANFGSEEPLVDTQFQHPYAYLMFLGPDGGGNMIPSSKLRDKYCVQRRDGRLDTTHSDASDDDTEALSRESETDLDQLWMDVRSQSTSPHGVDGKNKVEPRQSNGNALGDDNDNNEEEESDNEDHRAWGGGSKIPGIDMSSLD